MSIVYISESDNGSESEESEYVATPHAKKTKRSTKRKLGLNTSNISSNAEDLMEEIDDLLVPTGPQNASCTCKGKCATKACECRLRNMQCGPSCQCCSSKCNNQIMEIVVATVRKATVVELVDDDPTMDGENTIPPRRLLYSAP